ncbi:MAG: class I SAM-dependent rRNA methyltransferase [Gammaproteobacteria bacterium]|nr:class I SAM-dependent rRNA methyltransferase [Gammaproteobacteria bacterium]
MRKDRQRSLEQGHPWVFYGSLQKPPGNLPAGLVVDLVDERDQFLARGQYNDRSQIVVRVLTFREETVDAGFIADRIAAAVARRSAVLDGETDSCRLVFAEADQLPGLIVDRYAGFLVVQILTAGMEVWRDAIVTALSALQPDGIFERSDSEDRRRHEGLGTQTGLLAGDAPPDEVVIAEHGRRFAVDLREGHKTGYYLDQRENRQAVARYCGGARVLNAFAYTGGFGIYAGAAGAAEVTHIDSSAPALALCERNLTLNELGEGHELVCANVFDALREYRQAGRTFDVIVLDPPKFAATRKRLEQASRGYKDLNLNALRLLEPGGVLATFSCSGAIDADLFQKIVAGAASDAGRQVQVLEVLGQPVDHPVLLSFPEGRYLKGLVCRVID